MFHLQAAVVPVAGVRRPPALVVVDAEQLVEQPVAGEQRAAGRTGRCRAAAAAARDCQNAEVGAAGRALASERADGSGAGKIRSSARARRLQYARWRAAEACRPGGDRQAHADRAAQGCERGTAGGVGSLLPQLEHCVRRLDAVLAGVRRTDAAKVGDAVVRPRQLPVAGDGCDDRGRCDCGAFDDCGFGSVCPGLGGRRPGGGFGGREARSTGQCNQDECEREARGEKVTHVGFCSTAHA